jgi:hypothetical protein
VTAPVVPATRVTWKRSISKREGLTRWVSSDGWEITRNHDTISNCFRVLPPPHHPRGLHLMFWSFDEAKQARLIPPQDFWTRQRTEYLELAALCVGTYEPTQVTDYLHEHALYDNQQFHRATALALA